MFDPRLLRAKKGVPAFTPAIGLGTPVCAGAIDPATAVGGELLVLLPPPKGSLPLGMATDMTLRSTHARTHTHARASTPTVPLAEAYPAGAPNGSGRFCAKRASSKLGMRDLYGMPTSSPNGISVSASMRIM